MAAYAWRYEDPFGEFMQRWWDLATNMAWPSTMMSGVQQEQQTTGRFPVNVYEDGSNYYLIALLPGVNTDKLEVKAEGNVLTIAGTFDPHVPDGANANSNGSARRNSVSLSGKRR